MSLTVIPKAGEVFHGDDGTVSVVLPDKCNSNEELSVEEVECYAEWLGIDLQEERDLMWIAREGLQSPLPEGWKACRTGEGEVYYFNFCTGESNWDHPMDEFFKRKLADERAKLASGGRVKKHAKEAKAGEKRTFEKGAAGNVEDEKRPKGSVLSPSPFSAVPAPLPRGGRLGALGTAEAAQPILPDVRDIVPGKSEFSLSRRTLGSSGGSPVGVPTKVPEGVRELEAAIQQRIDKEIDDQRRAMRVRHEKQLSEERVALESAEQRLRREGEKGILGDNSSRVTQADIDAAQQGYEKQNAEIQMRIKELEAKLQREKATLEDAFNRSIEEVKKEVQAEQAAKAKEQQEAAAAALAKANEMSAKQVEEAKKESGRIVEKARKENEEEQKKRLEALSAELDEELNSAKKAAAEKSAAEEETILQKIASDAKMKLDAIRREYSGKEAKLRAEKEQGLVEREMTHSLTTESEKATLDEEEPLATCANETQRVVLEKGKANCSTVPIIASGRASQPATITVSTAEEEDEERRYAIAVRGLDTKHREAMGRIRSEHACALRERNLFNPSAAPEFVDLLHAAESAWLAENPEPSHEVPPLERIPASPLPPPGEEQQQQQLRMRGEKAARAASAEEFQKEEQRLEAVAKTLAEEVTASAAAYRTQRMQEVQAEIAQYRKEQQQKVLSVQQQQQEEESEEEEEEEKEEDEDEEEEEEQDNNMRANIASKADTIPLADVVRRENELRAQLRERIDVLQSAVQQVRAEQQQRQYEILHKQQQVKQPAVIQKPPTAPIPNYSTLVMNSTLSTIPRAQSVCSSARHSLMRPISCINPTVQSVPQEVYVQQQQQEQEEEEEEHVQKERQEVQTRNAVYEDRLRRAGLVLRERRRELRDKLQQMKSAREGWVRDRNTCRKLHDRQYALLLEQIKNALEKRARAMNREILELKRVSAFVRERELCFQRARSPGASGGAAVEMLEDILCRTEQIETYIGAAREQRRQNKHRNHRASSRRTQSLEKMWRPRHSTLSTCWSGGQAVISPLSLQVCAEGSEGVTRWLTEQQFSL